ncbi:dna/rna-binding protein kin17-like protein [Dermatophagoides farinae]|uniref:Dna/rna-binding protein kin17-like protein n=1 Tax=Dermatophagoides farinae TaxID=6954 RepID=A0A9D4NYQ1_DERFA|nr:DNA/RNA-binding protein KIN17-like [Dermatophagoides farinae]KAH7640667.1 dna/rna-binding protein kin17-like protein [Dermatophagoides farinae]
MGKHEPLTAKAIGKRIKAKGLQKLKFYCQMCQKQCRDANGFKCHLTSEAHQRQLLLFSENPNRYMDEFSSDFLKDFLHLLKRRYSTKRVLANQVYQEYIKDRDHLHMNSTRWCTLTGLVKWMGRKGICHVENNEKGWFITYIDRDPETLLRNENKAKKEKMFRDDDERQAQLIQEQIERGKRSEIEYRLRNSQNTDDTDQESNQSSKQILVKEDPDQKITFSLAVKKSLNCQPIATIFNNVKPLDSISSKTQNKVDTEKKSSLESKSKSKKSALEEILEEQERWKARKAASQHRSNNNSGPYKSETWMQPGIIVRIVTKQLGSEYYEKKARIESIESPGYAAIIKLLSNGDLIRVDERHLETVVPSKSGSKVMILKGLYRGQLATIVRVDEQNEKF